MFQFREIGKGYQSICKFAAIMNMPSPMNVKSYIAINNNLLNIYNEVASASMSTAANETKGIISKSTNNNDVSAYQVSVDGNWRNRGHQSINGIVVQYQERMENILIQFCLLNFQKFVVIRTIESQYQNIKIGK